MDIYTIGVERIEKPILMTVVMKDKTKLHDVRLNHEVPIISGFLAIESQEVKGGTQYISLDSIESFTLSDEETHNLWCAFPRE